MNIIYNIESPQNNSISKYGIIKVEGWAFSTEDEFVEIEIRMNHKRYNSVERVVREDVAACHEAFAERAKNSGFAYTIELSDKEKVRTNFIEICAKTRKGKQRLGQYSVVPEHGKTPNINTRLYSVIMRTFNYLKRNSIPKSKTEWALCYKALKWYMSSGGKTTDVSSKVKADAYAVWNLKNAIDERKIKQIKKDLHDYTEKPLISIVMPTYNSDLKLLGEAIDSISTQIYENWELCIVDDCSPDVDVEEFVKKYVESDKRIRAYKMDKNSHISLTTNYGIQQSKGQYIFLMDHDDLITPNALAEVVKVINQNENVEIIYSDDDKIDMNGNVYDPQFKPDYSPELLLSYMYFSHIFVFKRELFDIVGGFRAGYEGAQDYDLALRLTEKAQNIVHIPKILYHWRATPQSTAKSAKTKPYSLINGLKAVADAAERRNMKAVAYTPKFAEEANLGIFALKYAGTDLPLISIVIPTKNQKDILERCVGSIQKLSTYPNYEIVIVDNDSDDTETLKYLSTLPHKIVKCSNINGKFNFSRMVNFGVKHSNGEYIILLNNDTEVIEPAWMENMLVYMKIDGVGVVGSKLLYSDHRVQHAGVVLRMFSGIAGHAFKLIPDYSGGYLSYANVARNYSAVTAACFMTSRAVYQEVGGFDEENYAVSFNDVDYCLRVGEKGHRIVYSPGALLFHHEGRTRGVEQSGYYSDAKEEFNFVSKWLNGKNLQDKYYNPNLSYANENFNIECNNVISNEHRKLNVLLITHNLNYEGAPLMQYKIAKYLKERGYTFFVISCEDGPLGREYDKLGIQVFIENINEVRSTSSYSKYVGAIDAVAKKYVKFNFDLIYANTIESFWGIKLGRKMHLPTIWGVHESIDYHKYYMSLGTECHQDFVNSFMMATKVAFVANATSALYQDLCTYNYITIKNGIDLEKVWNYQRTHQRDQIRESLGIGSDTAVISIMGSVCERKGQLVFVKAAKKLLESKQNVLFQIVGAKESHYLSRINEYVAQNHMEQKVRVVYICDDIFQYYVASDMYVCASFEESSPQVILEAMAFKLPIVSTNVFGIPELVRDNQDALLVDANDECALAESMKRILEDKELAEKLVTNSYYRVQTFFTIEKMIDGYDQLFQNVYEEGENRVYSKYIEK